MRKPGIVEKIASDDHLVASAEAIDGGGRSWERPFPAAGVLEPSVDVSVWIAEPGVYKHRPIPVVETAYFVEGSGEFEIDGYGRFELEPGLLVVVPRETAGTLTVRKTARALVILPLEVASS